MKRVNIENLITGAIFHADFENDTDLNNWITKNIEKNTWGKPERWERETDGSHLDTRQAGVEGEEYTEYLMPAQYTVSEPIDITAEVQAREARTNRLAQGKAVRQLCENILDLIAGFNIERGLTVVQLNQMTETFGTIQALLEAKRPFSAKPEIEAVEPDGVIVTQEMKDAILNEYTLAGF